MTIDTVILIFTRLTLRNVRIVTNGSLCCDEIKSLIIQNDILIRGKKIYPLETLGSANFEVHHRHSLLVLNHSFSLCFLFNKVTLFLYHFSNAHIQQVPFPELCGVFLCAEMYNKQTDCIFCNLVQHGLDCKIIIKARYRCYSSLLDEQLNSPVAAGEPGTPIFVSCDPVAPTADPLPLPVPGVVVL